MTTKERLHLLVERLSESEAEAELARLEAQTSPDHRAWPPRHAAIGTSGQADLASRSAEILRVEFPSSRASASAAE